MITKPFVGVLFALCAGAAPTVADAADTRLPDADAVGCLQVEQGWARLPPAPTVRVTAGYATLRNSCSKPVMVTGARSPAFAEVSLHETTVKNDVSRMQPVHHLRVEAGKRVELKPGGLHLMLMQARSPLKEGVDVPVVLQLDDGSEVSTALKVRRTQAAPAHAH